MENYLAYSTEELLSIARSGFGEIGYQEELLLPQYQFADFLSPSYQVREIQLAGFAQQPPSYRTASFGVLVAPSTHERIADFMALGAPHIFVIDPSAQEVDRWKFQAAKQPQLVEKIRPDALLTTIRAHHQEWGPESVLRAKSIGVHAGPVQLDFYDNGLLPVLEREVHQKLDQLFKRAITIASEAYRQRHQKNLEDEDYRGLFRLIFRLVAAKLLTDRQHPGNWADPDVNVVIQNINNFYFKTSSPEQILPGIAIQQAAWDEIRTGFHLQNVSLEALAYVYENTFVSQELRQAYGTHATPPEVAEFVVRQLPFEAISDCDQRTVFEPFAGHAPFLTAALGRLRSLLPSSVGVGARHEYLVRMLSGIELDSFACEIAWHSLILADYPNPNGWRIEEADAFTSSKFGEFLTGANIVLCNPPFGQFTAQERAQYTSLRATNKAVEVLLRVLETPPLMLGFVLPRSFTDGRSYRAARKRLADIYGNISLIALPDVAFRFSEAETVVLLAYDRAATERKWYRAFIAKRDYDRFWRTGRPTWEDIEHVGTPIRSDPQLWQVPLAKDLKKQLQELIPLGQVADIHRGIEYIGSVEDHVSTNHVQGFVPGLQNVEDGLEPYIIRGRKYLQVDPAVMRTNAYLFPWAKKKVIANAARISRGPWRIIAAIDEEGLVCYQRLHGIWSKNDTPLELIVAILNGPVANALLSASETTRDNLIKELKAIPLPRLSADDTALVRELVHAYRSLPERRSDQVEKKNDDLYDDLMVQIDTIVLSGYELPDWLESELMYFIGSVKRPHSSLSLVEQLRHRHGRLVDKKLKGLSSIEVRELQQIERLLDAAEASYYAPSQTRLAGHVKSNSRAILKQIELQGFKSIKDMHLDLRPLNVLIGANGAGKSNFVSFFKMLHEMMTGRLQNYIGTAGYSHSLLHYGPKTTAQVEALLQFEVENGVDTYHMTLVPTAGDTLIFAEETLSFVQTDWLAQPKEVSLGAGHQETRLSDAADRGEPIAEVVRNLLRQCQVYQFHDTSATARIRQYCYVEDDRWLSPDAGNLAAVLYRLRRQDTSLAYRRIVGTIRQIAPFFGDFELQPTGSGDKDIILNWREKNSDQIFGPHQLSDGTLRAIALITLLLQPVQDLPGLLIVDEPELGLHPAAMNIVAELLQKASHHCQVIIATQSSALLDMFEPDDVIVVDKVDQKSTFRRLDPVSLQEWLEEYTLGQLWEKNVFGGGPF